MLLTGEIFQNIQHWPKTASSGTRKKNVFSSVGAQLVQSCAPRTIPRKLLLVRFYP